MKKLNVVLSALMILAAFSLPAHVFAVSASYSYSLANYEGIIPYNWVHIYIDDAAGETYVADPDSQTMKVFNNVGMETYEFLLDGFGSVIDFAADSDGNFLLLNYPEPNSSFMVTKCNYRGEPVSKITLTGLPGDLLSHFSPDTFIYKNDRFYFASKAQMKVVVTDVNGVYQTGYDLASIIHMDEKARSQSAGIFGFTVGNDGKILFTIPTAFSVYILSPDGKVASFGSRGGAPGKFNIVSGIATDDNGYIYVTDKLKSAVLVFDRDHNFKLEFGYRGPGSDNLIVPYNLAVSRSGNRLYVSQLRRRGVSVFSVNYDS